MKSRKQKSKFRKAGRLLRSYAFGLLILGAGCADISRVRYGQETVKMAVLPSRSLQGMADRYLPLLRYLSNETGYDVQYISSNSYSGFAATVQGSDVQLVLADPLSLLTLQKAARAEILAVGWGAGGSLYTQGLVIAPQGSRIEDLKDLSGRRVGLASQRSAEGFLSQAWSLKEQGIDVRKDIRLVPCGNMDEVKRKLRAGRLEAGFIGLEAWEDSDIQDLKIVAHTEPVPHWAIAALPGTAPEIAEKIKSALLAMGPPKEGQQKILAGLGLVRFGQAEEPAFDDLKAKAERLGIPY